MDNLNNKKIWHSLSESETVKKLDTTENGLTSQQAALKLETYGKNELTAKVKISALSILLEQFKNVLIIILLVATILSAFLGHGLEAIVITVIVFFAVLLGFFQEYRAEQALEALKKMAAPTASIIRDGLEIKIDASNLVPGDLVILRAGDKIPADLRLIESINLQTSEASLTGESLPVQKNIAVIGSQEIAIGDRINLGFAGTSVTYGRGKGLVVETGMNTEFGKIAQMLQEVKSSKTPLQENLDKLGHTLAKGALGLVAVVIVIGLFRGISFIEMFVFGISLAVAVVPEALPAVVTISLAIGVKKMVKRNALIRHLPAVETLGSTSVICSDKTGTLTKDEMTVRKIYVSGQSIDVTGSGYAPIGEFLKNGTAITPTVALKKLLEAGVLSSDAVILESEKNKNEWEMKGDPTEGALLTIAAKAGYNKAILDKQFIRLEEIPFTSETKRMTTLHKTGETKTAFSKGAYEVILDSCTKVLTDEGEKNLDNALREKINTAAKNMAESALRVLAVSSKNTDSLKNAENEMTFLGLVGMIDPPRAEVKKAIEICEKAGIKPIMITGDHPVTAAAIAKELGILKNGRLITGVELSALSETEFEKEVANIDVYARVSPEHKLRVVTALQKNGQTVAMTGDGVNDAPALKKADIGVAMGITGSDVTKEAGAMTLLDDNFASIVAAVEEGRGIFNNIKKYLMYLLSSNLGEIGLILVSSILGFPLPLTAVQILYVNLATDGLPALALAIDPPEDDLMLHKPRKASSGIFTPHVLFLIITGGVWSTIINLSLFAWMLSSGRTLKDAMAVTFISLVLIQFLKAYNFRSAHRSAFHKPFANKWLNITIIWEFLLLCAIVYFAPLQKPFGTFSLHINEWVIIFVMAFSIVPVIELAKWFVNKKYGQL
jgi:Ca2+-transporting ATPase